MLLFLSYIEAITEAKAVDKLLASGELDDEHSETNKPFLGVPFTAKEAMAVTGALDMSFFLVR